MDKKPRSWTLVGYLYAEAVPRSIRLGMAVARRLVPTPRLFRVLNTPEQRPGM